MLQASRNAVFLTCENENCPRSENPSGTSEMHRPAFTSAACAVAERQRAILSKAVIVLKYLGKNNLPEFYFPDKTLYNFMCFCMNKHFNGESL